MPQKIRGIISLNRQGIGYLKSEELNEDIKIETPFLNTALHNDEIEVVLLLKGKKDRKRGEVTKIIKRNKKFFVGNILKKKKKNFAFLVADDPRMYVDIFIPNAGKVKKDTKALAEIVCWDDPKKNPEGRIVNIIGKKGDNEAELHSIVLEKGLPIDFSPSAKKEARQAKEKPLEAKNRLDLRHLPIFTIDPEEAKDFDDALSVQKISTNLYEIGVHIADVSYYVEEKSKLDYEARQRAFSIYLVDRTIPMLPEDLSNDICSLNPKQDRAAFSVIFTINERGEIKKKWFGETLINSKERFNYKEAQNILDNKKGSFYNELSLLKKIAENLQKKRLEQGALRIEDEELLFHLDHDGRPIDVYKKEHLFTHNLIEEFMILANKAVAETFNTFYRVHEPPDKKMIDNLLAFLAGLGYRINMKGNEITSSELNNLFEKIKGKDEEFLVKMGVLRAMSKAEYSVKNKKHFGLALKEYTHFTSPIRRYADLVMHRIVKKKLKKKKINPEDFKNVAQEISAKELDVLDAERASVSYKQVEYMTEKVGEEFDVVVSGITSSGIFVQELKTRAEGMISVRDMDDDYYVLDEETYSLIGMRKKKRYALGNKIKVKLVEASLENRRLNFSLI